MKNLMKKIIAFALALVVCMATVTVASQPTEVKADADAVTLYSSPADQYATAGVPTTDPIAFNLDTTSAVDFYIMAECADNVNVAVTDVAGNLAANFAIPVTTAYSSVYVGYNQAQLAAGTYYVTLTFGTDNAFIMDIERPVFKMNQQTASVTVGFSTKLSVDGIKVKSWKSSNKKVATVKNGKVTGKKPGKCKITAVLANGEKVTCSVKVQKNVYKTSKITTSSVSYGNAGLRVHSMSYDKHGNLVLKARFANNCGWKVVQLKNIKITVKNENGKKIGVFKLSKKNTTVRQGATKDFTFTIKKSSLKIKKKSDLVNASVVADGTYYYQY